MKAHRVAAFSFLLGACIAISAFTILTARGNEPVSRPGCDGSADAAPSASIHASQASPFSDVYAVVVGISDYPGIANDLEYCDDDATDIAFALQTRFNVPSTHITVIKDSAATTQAITGAIAESAGLMDGDDYLLFAYSGHGGHSMGVDATFSWSVSSPHYYPNNYDNYWHYNHPGAQYMRVHFTRVDVESTFDHVYVGDYHDTYYYVDDLSGSYGSVWSSWVNTDDIYVELLTDSSNTGWGFEVDLVQVGSPSSPYFINPYDPDFYGLSGGQLDAILNVVPGKVVTILDTCSSGGVAGEMSRPGRYTVAACTHDEMSIEDGTYQNGVFTYQFLNAWETATDSNGDDAVSFEEVFPTAYANTVSRSTSLGSAHHPVQADNVTGDVVFYPNAVLGAVTEDGSHNLSFNFTHNGIGLADLIVAFYDAGSHEYRIQHLEAAMIGQDGVNSRLVLAPGNFTVNGYSVALKASFFGASESRASFSQDPGTFTATDSDGDGLSDLYEFEHAMNPWSTDSDGDGLGDAQEVNLGLSPVIDDLERDDDGDFMTNIWEIAHGLDPTGLTLYSDQDGDSLMDWQEFRYGGDPMNPDTDGDGLKDGLEFSLGFDLLDPDMDDDGFPDGLEYYLGSDPMNPLDSTWFHVIAIAVVVAVPLLVAAISRGKGKAKRPAPPGPRPQVKSKVKEPTPFLAKPPQPAPIARAPAGPAAAGAVTYASYPAGPRYSAPTAPPPPAGPRYSAPTAPPPAPAAPAAPAGGKVTQLPPLAPDIQRQLDSLPPAQREAVRQMILQKLNERMAQGSQGTMPNRFCIHCGSQLSGNLCSNCGWDSSEAT
ncbi:MAG: caspase family protein [Candidatus Lokiarchaeota archaeon]|nr:caspase family protein [Candidatus Lokiarchaeota archaeon]